MLWVLLLHRRRAPAAVVGAAGGLAVLARVDALVLLAVLAARLAWRRELAALGRMALACAVVAGPWFAWSAVRFGTVVPDSGAVKVEVRGPGRFAQAAQAAAPEVARAAIPEALIGPRHQPRRWAVALGALAVVALAAWGARRFALAAVYAVALAQPYFLLNTDTAALARYLQPAWAVLVVLVAAARPLQHPAPVLLVLLLHGEDARRFVSWDRRTEAPLSFVGAALRLAPQVLDRVVPPGGRAGAFDAGALGYGSPEGVVNLDGLMNHDVAALRRTCLEPARECLLAYMREKRIGVLAGGTAFAWTHLFPDWKEWPLLYASPALRDGDRLVVLRVPRPSRAD